MEDIQASEHQQEQQQRHAKIDVADFAVHVRRFQQIVDMCNTSNLGTVTKAYMKNIMEWGVCIEEGVESLSTNAQRDALARALPPILRMEGATGAATLSCIRQGPVINTDEAHEQPRMLEAFIEDAANVVACHGRLAAMSHAYSSLLVCVGGSHESVSSISASAKSGQSNHEDRTRRRPCFYEMSVETAQKRAYARNCYDQLLKEYQDLRQDRRAPSFMEELADIASGDVASLEVLCLVLLEPWRRTAGTDSLHPSLNNTLLQQVLMFRDDSRLWSLDSWLLAEIAHLYEPFAEVYLNQLIHSPNGLNEIKRREEGGQYITPTDLWGLRFRRDNIEDRLRVLGSRSKRLKYLIARRTSAG